MPFVDTDGSCGWLSAAKAPDVGSQDELPSSASTHLASWKEVPADDALMRKEKAVSDGT